MGEGQPIGAGGLGRPDALSDLALEECVRAAIAAPSIHNSQPWRFRIRAGGIDVIADWERRLEIIDPSGRELLISIGAAVFNLRVAMCGLMREPRVELFPDAEQPDLIAHVQPAEATPESASLGALADAIHQRHTNRRPFTTAVVPAAILAELTAAVRREGASLHVADLVGRTAILGLLRAAEQRLRSQGVYRAEVTGLPRPVQGRHESPVLSWHEGPVVPAHGPWGAVETMPLRDFGLTEPQLRRPIDPYEGFPTIVVLSTEGDDSEQWIMAGQALQRMLLLATQRGLAATPMSQPLEIPDLRKLVAAGGGWPQVLLCLGYAPPGAPTARRPLTDVLTHE